MAARPQPGPTGDDSSRALPPLRRLRRALGRIGREAALYPTLLRGGRRPGLAVLPSEGRAGASLLRGFNMADALQGRGWRTMVVPHHLSRAQRHRVLGLFRPDLLLVQQARHPLNRVEHLQDWPTVLDIDDADFMDPALEPALSAILARAEGAVCGSRFIRDWAQRHGARARVIWTGTPVSPGPWPLHADRRPLVTWAQLGPEAYRAELGIVAHVMVEVARRRGPVDLRLYSWSGPRDAPELEQMQAAGVRIEILPRLSYDDYLASLREAAVGLSAIARAEGFAQGKSFGKILGYLDAKVPVICSDAADHALFFRPGSGVVSDDPAVWADTVCALLDDPARRQSMADAAHADFRSRLSVDAAADRLHAFLTDLLNHPVQRAT